MCQDLSVFFQGHRHLRFCRCIGDDLLLKGDHGHVACYFWTFGDRVSQRDFARIVESRAQPIHLFGTHIWPELLELGQILGVIGGFIAVKNATNGIDILGVIGNFGVTGERRNGEAPGSLRRRALPAGLSLASLRCRFVLVPA